VSPGDARAFLGVDLGTSGLKLSLVGADGVILAEAEESYDVRAPAPSHAETDPAEWAAALHRAGERLAASRPESDAQTPVAAIGVTGQMHGVVLTDRTGRPVRAAVLWPDQRAADVLPRWRGLSADARARLANPLVAGMPGPLLTWLNEHERASLDAAARVTTPKDWLRGHLTEDTVGERSDASATLLWDVVADDWSTEGLSLAGISRDQLPPLVASDEVVGASDFGGSNGATSAAVPVVAGAADTAAALVALRATQQDRAWNTSLVVNAGTGIQIVRPGATAGTRTDPITHLYADADGGWYDMLAIQNGGIALSWVQQALDVRWEELVTLAKQSPAGSKGALFLPFLTGERGGVASPGSTASWSSLTTSTSRPELARSAFEAFAFTVRRGIAVLGGHQGAVLLSGGGARDPWVRQLLADVLDRPLRYVRLRSASALGAAVLAARGIGVPLPVPATSIAVTPTGRDRDELDLSYARWLNATTS
jgi:xylulokinase